MKARKQYIQSQYYPVLERMPKQLQGALRPLYQTSDKMGEPLHADNFYQGDARELLTMIDNNSVALSVWSPPYFVGKDYEAYLTFEEWQQLLSNVINLHFAVIKPGGFLAINIADILCFKDEMMPKIQAMNIKKQKSRVTRQDVLDAMEKHPGKNKYQLAKLLGCSEQTVDRRLHGNNIRGGKYDTQTRVKIVGGLIEKWAMTVGFYLYDRRIWVKDAAWENSRWASLSYRSVDEFEYIYILWKPGLTVVDRNRLTPTEWKHWGSRGVWIFPSVRANDDHEAKFPVELPRRIIKLFTDPGELILDCFMGSGSTAIAALMESRHFLGIELEKKYVQLSKQRVSKFLKQGSLNVH